MAKPKLGPDGYPLELPGYCNARTTRNGQKWRCGRTAGWGTPYRNGSCRDHGGSHRNGRKHAALIEYEQVYAGRPVFGRTIDTDPTIGLLNVVAEYAGFTAYLKQELLEDADNDGRITLVEDITGPGGAVRRVVDVKIQLWMDALDRYARICKMARDADTAKIKTDLMESYADRVLDLVDNIIRSLGLNPDDPHIVEAITRQFTLITSPEPGEITA
jgi:hypothetical protein